MLLWRSLANQCYCACLFIFEFVCITSIVVASALTLVGIGLLLCRLFCIANQCVILGHFVCHFGR